MTRRATWRKRGEALLWFVPGINLLAGDAHGRRWRSPHPWRADLRDEADYDRIKRKGPYSRKGTD